MAFRYTARQHREWLEAQRAKDFGPSKPLTGGAFLSSYLGRRAELQQEYLSNLPAVRIRSAKPKASRSSINRTASSQEHKHKIESGKNKYIPAAYGPCCPKPRIFAADKDGSDLIMGIWFCLGEIEEFTKIYINDDDVPGTVTVQEHKGTTTQTADSILSNISGYTDTLVLDVNGTNVGVAYLALRIPPGAVKGFPRVTAKIKGNAAVEDTRGGGSTAYSDLSALCFRNWLKSSIYGPGVSVLDSSFETAATFNEEVPGNAWQASHNYAISNFATPTGANALFRIYEVTTDAGSSGAGEPSWNTTLGATTSDSGITWTCREGRRHVCGMVMDQKASISDWIETWRTACGSIINWGESGIEIVPDKARATDHTFLHASSEILESPGISLAMEELANIPTVIRGIYTDTSKIPWRDAEVRVAASGVDAGTTPDRDSVIYCPWVHRYSEAKRIATERLNAASLTDLSFPLHVFDKGLKVKAGDVIEVTHPIGLSSQKMRVLNATQGPPGRAWMLDCYKYDSAVYSDLVESEPSVSDFQLNKGNTAADFYYANNSTLESLRPAEANANVTGTHTALGATYLDGSINRSTDAAVEIKKDLKMMGGVDISFYDSGDAYKGGIYGAASGVYFSNLQIATPPSDDSGGFGAANLYYASIYCNLYYAGGSAGITQSETGVTDFDVVYKGGLVTSFTKNN